MELQIKLNLGLMKNSEVLMKSNTMTSLMVPMMTFLWAFVSLFYLDFLVVLLKSQMTPLMVPIMDFLWVNKWKVYLAANVMYPLMVPMMAFMLVHTWKFYLSPLMVIMKANLMAPLKVLGTRHT